MFTIYDDMPVGSHSFLLTETSASLPALLHLDSATTWEGADIFDKYRLPSHAIGIFSYVPSRS